MNLFIVGIFTTLVTAMASPVYGSKESLCSKFLIVPHPELQNLTGELIRFSPYANTGILSDTDSKWTQIRILAPKEFVEEHRALVFDAAKAGFVSVMKKVAEKYGLTEYHVGLQVGGRQVSYWSSKDLQHVDDGTIEPLAEIEFYGRFDFNRQAPTEVPGGPSITITGLGGVAAHVFYTMAREPGSKTFTLKEFRIDDVVFYTK